MEPTTKTASLRTAMGSLSIDPEKGTISGCSIMTIGPAQGWGFMIDKTTLEQTMALLNAGDKGVKCRFDHPSNPMNGLGRDVGYISNGRIEGEQLRGDVTLASWASSLPGLGDVRSYLMGKCREDPGGIGLSAVIEFTPEPIISAGGDVSGVVARVKKLVAVDFVENPAANPNGLLSQVPGALPGPAIPEPEPSGMKGKNMEPNTNSAVENKPAALAQPAATPPAPDVVELETARVASLRALGKALSIEEGVVTEAIASGEDAEKARARFLASLQKAAAPVPNINIQVGTDQRIAAMRTALPEAICLRAGVSIDKPHDLARKIANLTVLDMYRDWLAALGVPESELRYISRSELCDVLGQRRAAIRFGSVAALAQGTSDFSNILLDAANKTARRAYELAPSTWQLWCNRGTAPDFKNINRVQLSDVPALTSRLEGGEIKYAVVSDSKETYTLVEYISGIIVTRRALLNDDLNVLSRVPTQQVLAAKQLEDDVAYAVLTANANLADTGALFNGTAVTTAGGHANLDAATANVGAPSVTTLGLGRKAMRLQKGPKGQYLNLSPKFLIVPAALESVAEQYTSNAYQATTAATINPFAPGGRTPLTPIVQPRLDATSAAAWYLAADPAMIDTVEVSFLQGEEAPVIKSETNFDTDDLKMAVRHTVAAKALDFRGLYKNNGTV